MMTIINDGSQNLRLVTWQPKWSPLSIEKFDGICLTISTKQTEKEWLQKKNSFSKREKYERKEAKDKAQREQRKWSKEEVHKSGFFSRTCLHAWRRTY